MEFLNGFNTLVGFVGDERVILYVAKDIPEGGDEREVAIKELEQLHEKLTGKEPEYYGTDGNKVDDTKFLTGFTVSAAINRDYSIEHVTISPTMHDADSEDFLADTNCTDILPEYQDEVLDDIIEVTEPEGMAKEDSPTRQAVRKFAHLLVKHSVYGKKEEDVEND